ncbi:MAG TPA: UDP-glucose/GDP-mannose dehydrogenase family protein [Candidatus Nanoarchaeia archaeon]|nr:UDP-glucose/GDP-mannose dehydrogenase family protein [Candidatus Nanoarchaeia archaeon]
MKISVFGTGYVGLVTGASLANLGHEVLCMDVDQNKIGQILASEMPFYEPGLKELVQKNRDIGRLTFSTDFQQAVQFGKVLFNCVGTPGKEDGSAELKYVFEVVENIVRFANEAKVIVNKSTVPPGTARKCAKLINQLNPRVEIEVVSNPEFLKQGNAVYDFNHPDKIVVGANSTAAFQTLQKVYHGLIKTYIPILEMDWESAEMVKYANNSFLATKISFINEIANICERVGADIRILSKAIGMDYRIGPKFLNAGIGYGGSCFPKDVRALIHTAKEHGYTSQLLNQVEKLNELQKTIFIPKIKETLARVQGDTVTLWGLSFKPKTSDLRGATSLRLIEELQKESITIKVYDPIAQEEAKKILKDSVTYSSSIKDSVSGSNLIILVTEWDEFRNVNFIELGGLMKSKIIFDGRNIYEPEQLKEAGFEYYGVGRK